MANSVEVKLSANDQLSQVFEQASQQAQQALAEAQEKAEELNGTVSEGGTMDVDTSAAQSSMESAQGSAQDMNEAVEETGEEAEGLGSKIKGAFGKVEENWKKVSAAAGGAGLGFEALGRKQGDLNESLDRVAGATGKSADEVKDLAQAHSDATVPIEEVTGLMETGSQLGLESSEDLGKFADTWDMIGDATGISAEKLADQSAALQNVGIGAGEEGEALDAFGYITQDTTQDVEELMKFLDRSGSELDDMGMDVDDTAAMLGLMEDKLGKSGRTARQEFRQAVGDADGDLNEMLDTLGLSEDDLEEYTEKVEGSSDVLEDNAESHQDNMTTIEKLTNKVNNAAADFDGLIDVGTMLAPVLIGIGPAIKGAAGGFRILTAAMNANPFMAIATLITAVLIPAIIYIVKNWDEVSAWLKAAWDKMKGWASDIFSAIGNAISDAWGWIKEKTASIWNGIKEFLVEHWDTLLSIVGGPIGALVALVIKNWDKIKERTNAVWEWIKETAGTVWGGIKTAVTTPIKAAWNIIKGVWNTTKEVTSSVWDTIKEKASAVWQGIKVAVTTPIKKAYSGVQNVINKLKEFLANIWGNIKDEVKNQWEFIKTAITNPSKLAQTTVGKRFTNLKNKLRNIWNKVKEVASNVWQKIKDALANKVNNAKTSVQNKFTALKNKISDIWNKVKGAATKSWQAVKNTLSNKVNAAKTSVQNKFNNLKSTMSGIWDKVKGTATNAWNTLKNTVRDKAVAAKDKAVNAWDTLKTKTSTMFGDAKEKAKEKLSDIVTSAKELPGKIGRGITDKAKDAVGGVKDLGKKIVDTFKEKLGIKSPSTVFEKFGQFIVEGLKNGLSPGNIKDLGTNIIKKFGGGIADKWSDIKDFASGGWSSFKDIISGDGGTVKAPSGESVEKWRGQVKSALSKNDLSTSKGMVDKVLKQIETESGGNEKTIQSPDVKDINTAQGNPARGLMQTIPETFNAHKHKGHGNIMNGYDNMLAALAYAKERYGKSLSFLGQGHGYAKGGIAKSPQIAELAKNGPEANIPLRGGSRSVDMWKWLGEELGVFDGEKPGKSGNNKEFAKTLAKEIVSALRSEEDNNVYRFNLEVPLDGETIANKTFEYTQKELAEHIDDMGRR